MISSRVRPKIIWTTCFSQISLRWRDCNLAGILVLIILWTFVGKFTVFNHIMRNILKINSTRSSWISQWVSKGRALICSGRKSWRSRLWMKCPRALQVIRKEETKAVPFEWKLERPAQSVEEYYRAIPTKHQSETQEPRTCQHLAPTKIWTRKTWILPRTNSLGLKLKSI